MFIIPRFDFKIVARGETDAGYYYEGNDFSQVEIHLCVHLLLPDFFLERKIAAYTSK